MSVFNYFSSAIAVDMTKLDQTLLAGHDQITGSKFDDVLAGGAGNDDFEADLGNDTLIGGLGKDSVYYASGRAGDLTGKPGQVVDLSVGQSWGVFGNDTLSGIEDVYGTVGNDWIKGDDNANMIVGGMNFENGQNGPYGNTGNDVIFAMGGNDLVVVGDSNNAIYGGDGNDEIIAGSLGTGNNWIEGGAGNDIVYVGNRQIGPGGPTTTWSNVFGGAGDDELLASGQGSFGLHGGDGNDKIYFGKGTTYVDGGAGADVFGFNTKDPTQVAGQMFGQVFDYQVGIDKVIAPTTAKVLDWGANTGIQYDDRWGTHTIMLMNVTSDQLTKSDWQLLA